MRTTSAAGPMSQTAAPDAPREGMRIASARGASGGVGFLARTLHDDRLVLVTARHVLDPGPPRADAPAARLAVELPAGSGAIVWGRRGIVRDATGDAWVDCAAVVLGDDVAKSIGATVDAAVRRAPLVPGTRVTKAGCATGTSEGVVVDGAYDDVALVDGRPQPAPRQILVRSATPGRPFSARGDSGAAVLDEDGALVGLLRGTNGSRSVACPVAPVLWVLHVRPVRAVQAGRVMRA